MSSPYENEYGAWDNEKFTANQIDFADPGINQLLKLNHQKDIDEFTKFKGVQKDDAYRSKAIQNIKAYPFKYVRNIYANISRMLFGFPGNYAYQRPPDENLVFLCFVFSYAFKFHIEPYTLEEIALYNPFPGCFCIDLPGGYFPAWSRYPPIHHYHSCIIILDCLCDGYNRCI
ncbi:MAG: hypothetical protein IPH84_18030 [Bacteroidales bacterium]|nr:hypothetical protein [Bacteroidales bacterium]